jgi:hypothetical protein
MRQQWNLSPAGSTIEIEDYQVGLDDISVLELANRTRPTSTCGTSNVGLMAIGITRNGGPNIMTDLASLVAPKPGAEYAKRS